MSEPFIAPDGAMQFEMAPKNAEIAGVPFLWVGSRINDICRQGHYFLQVLNAPERAVRYSKDVLGNRGWNPVVCECVGRLIE